MRREKASNCKKRVSRRPELSREIEFCSFKKTVGDGRKRLRGKKWPQNWFTNLDYRKKKTSREAICDALFSRIPKGQDRAQIYCWKTPRFCRMFCDFDGSMFMNKRQKKTPIAPHANPRRPATSSEDISWQFGVAIKVYLDSRFTKKQRILIRAKKQKKKHHRWTQYKMKRLFFSAAHLNASALFDIRSAFIE